MKTIGFIVKNKKDIRKIQEYFFAKGGRWNIWGKDFYIFPIGKYGTLITLHEGKYMGYYIIDNFDNLQLVYDLFDIKEFGKEKLKI